MKLNQQLAQGLRQELDQMQKQTLKRLMCYLKKHYVAESERSNSEESYDVARCIINLFSILEKISDRHGDILGAITIDTITELQNSPENSPRRDTLARSAIQLIDLRDALMLKD